MKFATLILSLFMLFKPILPVAEYVVLYDYIRNELCVNKDRPELKCNGKCHLKKEMAKASDSENSKEKHRFSSAENQIAVYHQIMYYPNPIFFLQELSKKILFGYNSIYTFSFSELIFRPPVVYSSYSFIFLS
ncbi:hypothetical protein QW060_04370 [Myroides ceti]|uniref:Uncharacterized protein n=2 Tax=Paenimyroides ceti TaxID=395087 RepID=A0ABT8CRT5_9FLAO|nr:hypothetical protein [Paenimyroides ceti]MDN3706358.1 hypothetical protein [Paenimyroides ceti]